MLQLPRNQKLMDDVKSLINQNDKIEYTKKDIFIESVNIFKEYSSHKKEDIKKSIISLYIEEIKDSTLKNSFKRVINSAMIFKTYNIEIVESLNYSNIERVLSLLDFIAKNESKLQNGLFKSSRDKMNTFIANESNQNDYYKFNNNLLEIITTIKKENKIVEIEDQLKFNFESIYKAIESNLNFMDKDQLEKINKMIESKLSSLPIE
jgi:hypothetical protein